MRDGTVVCLTDTTTLPASVVDEAAAALANTPPTLDEWQALVGADEATAFLAFVERHNTAERFLFKEVSTTLSSSQT